MITDDRLRYGVNVRLSAVGPGGCLCLCYKRKRLTSVLMTSGSDSTERDDFTSVLSGIMMYILLAFLTLWLLVEVVYCYRKISKAEEVTQESV